MTLHQIYALFAMLTVVALAGLIAYRAGLARARSIAEGLQHDAQQTIATLNHAVRTLGDSRAEEREAAVSRVAYAVNLATDLNKRCDALIESRQREQAALAAYAPKLRATVNLIKPLPDAFGPAHPTYSTRNITQHCNILLELAQLIAAPKRAVWQSVLVYGPEGCGKTRNATAIAQALGLTHILDDWQPGQRIPKVDTLVLTTSSGPFEPGITRSMSFVAAMKKVDEAQERAA